MVVLFGAAFPSTDRIFGSVLMAAIRQPPNHHENGGYGSCSASSLYFLPRLPCPLAEGLHAGRKWKRNLRRSGTDRPYPPLDVSEAPCGSTISPKAGLGTALREAHTLLHHSLGRSEGQSLPADFWDFRVRLPAKIGLGTPVATGIKKHPAGISGGAF